MADENKDERTEEATGKKRQDTREKGRVSKSQDFNAAALLLFGFMAVYLLGSTTFRQLSAMFRTIFSNASLVEINSAAIHYFAVKIFAFLGLSLLPMLGMLMVIGIISNVAQFGFLFSGEALQPKWSKLDPISGIKRVMISTHSLVEMGKGFFKTLIVGIVAYKVIDNLLAEAITLVDTDIEYIGSFLVSASAEVVIKVGIAFGAIAAFDYFYQKFEFNKNIRMTKQEVKEEFKTSEGDPLIKGRIKTIQRQIAYKRMMTDVPKADVVITNPTHFAVALKYQSGKMNAPKVVAKGADLIAQKIKEIAKNSGVPIVEDKLLAQALYKSVDIGDQIPDKLFHAVAQILAYIYRLKNSRNPKSMSL